jgi:hypothetical protein
MPDQTDDKLRLGKGASFFVKTQLRRLRQEDETWEADFFPIPCSDSEHGSVWWGLILSHAHDNVLAQRTVEEPPTVNDLAGLLAEAMRRPLVDFSHRPRCLYLRARPEWAELLPHLKQIGIQATPQEALPKWDRAFGDLLAKVEQARAASAAKMTEGQAPDEGSKAARRGKPMPRSKKPEQHFPIKLTQAQRQAIADFAPDLADRLKLDEPNQRVIDFSLAELKEIKTKAQAAIRQASTGTARRPLRHVLDSATLALDQPKGSGSIPAAERVYQFKITLLESRPPIWRRIQVKDCTLDKLHEHIQTAMGWTNSHLHHFRVGEQLYGDPDLMQENFEDMEYKDSTTTKVSDILPEGGKRFRFQYEYDFGDSWYHEVLVEGVVRAEPRKKYPLCLEGASACPPEDCGGIWGYADFVEAIQNPEDERHEELLEWVGGRFDPEAFDPAKATKAMKKGLPDWRSMAGW